jgi:hypothetical protein
MPFQRPLFVATMWHNKEQGTIIFRRQGGGVQIKNPYKKKADNKKTRIIQKKI